MDKKNIDKNKRKQVLWSISRNEKIEHSVGFYVLLLLLMSLLLLFSIWQKNILFGIFVIMVVGVIFFLSSSDSEVDDFIIDEDGIKINKETKYAYDEFRHFDIYKFSEDNYELFFVFKGRMKTMLRMRIWKRDVDEILSILSDRLPRVKTEPSFLDTLSKIVGI